MCLSEMGKEHMYGSFPLGTPLTLQTTISISQAVALLTGSFPMSPHAEGVTRNDSDFYYQPTLITVP